MQPQACGTKRLVAILSFALESNVFNPTPRRLSDFQVLHGEAYERDERQAGFVRRLRASEPDLFLDVEVKFVCLYRGWCGGLMPAEDFQKMKKDAAEGLKSLLGPDHCKLDGVCLDLHGAMGASGSDDPEAELAEAVRDAVPVGLLAASFDLHGNFSERLGGALDIVAAYKTFPHDDMEETKTKALRMLLHCLKHESSIRPTLVVITVPVILPGDKIVTTEGYGRELYRWLRDLEPPDWRTGILTELLGPVDDGVEAKDGLLDASFFVGHGHENTPRVGSAVVLTCSSEAKEACGVLAQQLAQWYWDRRTEFTYPRDSSTTPWHEALQEMYAAYDQGQKVLLGDLGDNANAGTSGDVPFVCRKLLEKTSVPREGGKAHPRVLIAGLADHAAVKTCAELWERAHEAAKPLSELPLPLRIGAGHAIGADFGEGCEALVLSDARLRGIVNEGLWAIVDASPCITLVLQTSPWAFFSRADVARLTEAFHPSNYDVVVVKRGNVASLVEPMFSLGEAYEPAKVCCIMSTTPGANSYPMPARPRLRPGMYPECPEREWAAPVGTVPPRCGRGQKRLSEADEA